MCAFIKEFYLECPLSEVHCINGNREEVSIYIQWNLRIMDKLGMSILSIVKRLSLRREKCMDNNRQGVNSMSIVERLSPTQSVPYQRFHCTPYGVTTTDRSLRWGPYTLWW